MRESSPLVTTSWLNKQAYEEIREDGHPVAVVSGADIVDVLKQHGRGTLSAVRAWLDAKYAAAVDARRTDFSFTSELRVEPRLGGAGEVPSGEDGDSAAGAAGTTASG